VNLAEYMDAPWLKQHQSFSSSFFSVYRAPEFSTGEVVLSSLYRVSGFDGVSEAKVKSQGDNFYKAAERHQRKSGVASQISPETWKTVLDRLVQSPKVAQQSAKRFMSLSPIVPDISLYSGAARLQGNPWNPGELVKRIVQLGSSSEAAAKALWERLHGALSVHKDDDIWARWLQGEFEVRRELGASWAPGLLTPLGVLSEDRASFAYPAKQFVADLDGIISAKSSMTRRQWISLLEAVLRIGSVSHILWICDVTDRMWRKVRLVLEDPHSPVPDQDAVLAETVFAVKKRMLSFGHPAIPALRDYASKYLSARLGLNCVLWALKDAGAAIGSLRTIAEVREFLNLVHNEREQLARARVLERWHDLQDKEVRAIACKKGIGSNLMEFAQYTLGQRQTMDEALRGYDQSYFLRKRGEARNSPWVLALGPASVLAMTHCCLHEVNGPRSVQRLAVHLSSYGIEFDLQGLNDSDLGRQLRMLGLVLDSPDAESGMLLVPPFAP
jgi:hypothetical protein